MNGIASLELGQTVYVGAKLPLLAQIVGGLHGRVCVKLQRDPDDVGWIDCDGGSNADVEMTIDSDGLSPAFPPTLTIGAGGGDSGAGAGVVRVLYQFTATTADATPCADADFSTAPILEGALTTGQGTSTVFNVMQNERAPMDYPDPDTSVALSGQPFNCATWGMPTAPSASMVI